MNAAHITYKQAKQKNIGQNAQNQQKNTPIVAIGGCESGFDAVHCTFNSRKNKIIAAEENKNEGDSIDTSMTLIYFVKEKLHFAKIAERLDISCDQMCHYLQFFKINRKIFNYKASKDIEYSNIKKQNECYLKSQMLMIFLFLMFYPIALIIVAHI